MPIPKLLHQTWKNTTPPEPLRTYMRNCKMWNPDLEYRFYDDAGLRAEVEAANPKYLPHYDAFQHTIERVDFARYALLYNHGGFYLDADMECVSSLSNFLKRMDAEEEGKAVFATEPPSHNGLYGASRVVCNAAMASPKGHPFWVALMDYIVENYGAGAKAVSNPVKSTGPMAITWCLEANPGLEAQVAILDHCTFYSFYDIKDDDTPCPEGSAVAIHRWAHTWTPSHGRAQALWWVKTVLVVLLILGAANLICGALLWVIWKVTPNNFRNPTALIFIGT